MEFSYLKDIKIIEPFIIECFFKDKTKGILDLSKYLKYGGVFEKLNDPAYFKTIHLDDGVITWGDGEVDIAPETVYLNAVKSNEVEHDINDF